MLHQIIFITSCGYCSKCPPQERT